MARFLSISIIVLTFLLLILGGVVHNTESSLACPDWPLCYGQVFPVMKDGVLIEHSHRLLASLVGFINILLVVVTFRTRNKTKDLHDVYLFSVLSLIMVIAQGILGGLTVIYRLPTIVSTTHLALSMVYFSTLVYIDHRLSLLKKEKYIEENFAKIKEVFTTNWKPVLKHGILLSAILIYLQILLGAFMRHSGAGSACGFGFDNSLLCLDVQSWSKSLWPSYSQSQLHMVHRYVAVFVTLVVFYFSFRSFAFFKNIPSKAAKILSVFSPAIILVQVIIGVWTVTKHLSVVPTTLHLTFGALSLIALWKFYLVMDSLEKEMGVKESHSLLSDLVGLTKPKLSALVLLTALVGLLLSPEHINFFKGFFALILICMVVMGATTLNCYMEMEIDGKMERTKNRSLPAGRMKPRTALLVGLGMLVVGTPLLAIYINLLTAVLSVIAAILYLLAYTPLKTKSPIALYVGAIPGAMPPLLGWAAVSGTLDTMAWTLFALMFIWQLPHFLAISIYHDKDYGAAGIYVYPNSRGMGPTKRDIFIYTLVLLAISIAPHQWGTASLHYQWAAIFLGLVFLVIALIVFMTPKETDGEKKWARQYFLASIVYLPLLLGAMVFLK